MGDDENREMPYFLSMSFTLSPKFFLFVSLYPSSYRGGEWYLEKRGSLKILTGSRNLGSVFDKSRSLVFAWFVFTFFESRNFLPKSLRLGFLTRVSASLGFYHSPPLLTAKERLLTIS